MSKMTPEQILNAFARTNVSMEENDLNINIQAEHEGEQVDEDQVPLDTSDAPETAELDVAEAIDETEEEIDGADDAVDVVESLESLLISLEAIQEQGAEFTPAAALLTQVAIDNAVSRMPGLSAEAIGIPSMEDFDYAPATSLTVSIEKIGETISAGWKATGEFIKKIWEKIRIFVTRMFDGAKAADMKLKSIDKELSSISSGTLSNDATVTVPGLIANGFKADSVKALTDALKLINTNGVKSSDLAVFTGVASIGQSDQMRTDLLAAFNSGIAKLNGKVLPFGGLKFVVGDTSVIKVESGAAGDSKAVKTPSLQEVKALATANGSLIQEILDIKKQEGRHKKLNETMVAFGAKVAQFKARNENDDVKKIVNSGSAAYTTAVSMYNQRVSFELNVLGKALSAANALNNVLASATAQYKKAAK